MKNPLISYLAFAVLAVLWLAFGAALVLDREALAAVWHLFRGWPLIGQGAVALLTLPVVLGLWIWNTGWPEWLRLALVAGLAWATLYSFFPKKSTGQRTHLPAES